MNNEVTITTLIAFAGSAKSKAFETINHAEANDFVAAKKTLAEAGADYAKAEAAHFELISAENDKNAPSPNLSLLLMHAEDQLMTANLMNQLAQNFINLHQKMKALK